METVNKTREQLSSDLEEMWEQISRLKASGDKHKEIEAQLKQSEERYKSIFNSVNDVLILIDKKGTILDVNSKVTEIGGYEAEELIGGNIKSLAKLMSKKSFAIVVSNFMKRMIGINVKPYEIEMFKKNGESVAIEVNAVTARDGNRIIGELAILRNITEHKRMYKALQQSEENLKTYLESAPDAIYINNLKGTFMYGNKKAEEITGYSRKELIGKSFLSLNLLPKGVLPIEACVH